MGDYTPSYNRPVPDSGRNPRAFPIDDLNLSDSYDCRANVPRAMSIRWRAHDYDSQLIHFDADDPKVVV